MTPYPLGEGVTGAPVVTPYPLGEGVTGARGHVLWPARAFFDLARAFLLADPRFF